MKKIKFLTLSLMALLMACFTACNNDSIPVDYSEYIVGTWTAHLVNYAEALVFNADGTMKTHIAGPNDEDSSVIDQYFEDHGTYTLKGNKLTMVWSDGTKYDITITISPYKLLAFDYDGNGIDFDYDYCDEDLADEVVGMWVCTDGPTDKENDMMIQVFNADGSTIMTGNVDELLVNDKSTTYKVVGDLLFLQMNKETVSYVPFRIKYAPNGTSLGDILTFTNYMPAGDDFIESTSSFLRVKETLDLTGKTYDYKSAYVTNAKGKDEDFTIMGNTFNIAKIKAYDFDKMFSANLFCVELNANSFKYKLRLDNGQYTGFDTPMTIDGNKVTLDMSAINPALRKVEMHMFQDANDNQVHFYMHTDAFINYFANMEVYTLIMEGKINQSDAAAVEKVFTDMEARVESINVSFVMKARK